MKTHSFVLQTARKFRKRAFIDFTIYLINKPAFFSAHWPVVLIHLRFSFRCLGLLSASFKLINLTMSDVGATSVISKCICIRSRCVLRFIACPAHAKDNSWTVYPSGNIATVAAGVKGIHYKFYSEFCCYSFKPTKWDISPCGFGFFRDSGHQEQEDKGSNLNEFHCIRSCGKELIETTVNILWRRNAFT